MRRLRSCREYRLLAMLGAASERQRSDPPQSAAALADITLPDQDGNEVRLGDLWADRPAALIWLRHYG